MAWSIKTGHMTTATAADVDATPRKILGMRIKNTHATVAGEFVVKDADGNVIWNPYIGAAGLEAEFNLAGPWWVKGIEFDAVPDGGSGQIWVYFN